MGSALRRQAASPQLENAAGASSIPAVEAHHALREATAQRSSIDDLKGFLINSPQFLSIKRSKAVNAFRTYIC